MSKANAVQPKSRFQIERLEERVAPSVHISIGNVVLIGHADVQGVFSIGDHNVFFTKIINL